MSLTLDYGKMRLLDAEELAGMGIKRAYDSMLDEFRRYGAGPAQVQEFVDTDDPGYSVKILRRGVRNLFSRPLA